MAEQLKFGDRLFLKGEKVILDNGIDSDAFIHSRNGKLVIGYNEADTQEIDHEVVIRGNLTVDGTMTSLKTVETIIKDNIIVLNEGETGGGVSAIRSGIEVDRGTLDNETFTFSEEGWLGSGGVDVAIDAVRTSWLSSTLSLTDDLSAENIYARTSLTINGDLRVTNDANINNDINVGNDANVTGNVEVLGHITASSAEEHQIGNFTFNQNVMAVVSDQMEIRSPGGISFYPDSDNSDPVPQGGEKIVWLRDGAKLVFEGTIPDDYEVKLQATDITADRDIILPDESGTLALQEWTTRQIDTLTTDDIEEGTTNLYWTVSRGEAMFDNRLLTKTTDDLVEGNNLYYLDERVDDRISNLVNASYGLATLYTDPANTFEIRFDGKNIGNTVDETAKPNSAKIFDDTNQNFEVRFRTLVTGPNLGITVTEDSNEIVIDTAVKVNNLENYTVTGLGTENIYTLPFNVSLDWHVEVFIDGVYQIPSVAYSITGTTLTLAAPLSQDSIMYVIKLASNNETTSITNANTLNAFAGSHYLDYTNFTNTPTIPTVPTNVSEFTNDSGYITNADIPTVPTNVSEFTNDSGYITNADIPTNHMVNDANNTVAGSISPTVDATYDLGTSTEQWNVIYGHTVEATYADLAERYAADAPYEPGTVLVFGGEAEVTTTTMLSDTKVVGIVSTDPALKMNSAAGNSQTHPYIALKGRVPCKVIGKIEKGDLLVTSSTPGYAKASLGVPMIGTVIGKAIEAKSGPGEGIIEVFVSIM
jgi:hypothetical protein